MGSELPPALWHDLRVALFWWLVRVSVGVVVGYMLVRSW